jgi:hypothetical protein
MGFTARGKKASVGYKKKYKNHLKHGGVPLNSVPHTADPQSNKKHKPAPTRMLSKADSVVTSFQCRMMIGGHFLMDGAQMQSEWYGDDGAIAKTLTLVGLPRNQASRRLIARVFAEVENCIVSNTDYAGITKKDRDRVVATGHQ